MSKFKLISTPGAKDTMLLIPGWATDYRIFNNLNIKYNYLLPVEFSPFMFSEDLLAAMKENGIKKISILGWSMGGFIACDIVSKYRDCVDEVIFVGVRRRYEKANNEKIKILLNKDRKAFLYKFYNDCISADSEAYKWFRAHLLKDYLESMPLDYLLGELDYLSEHQIEPKYLEGLKVIFVHGRKDRIAPIEEAMALKEALPQARFISIEGAGHIPFFTQEFNRLFL
ncbi:MAG: alpha/beta hydrolase [Candidatus Omnitrophica bacterium]|nr:alpha/beta hydrolase [Candidatus Omnitrophota bacterium]